MVEPAVGPTWVVRISVPLWVRPRSLPSLPSLTGSAALMVVVVTGATVVEVDADALAALAREMPAASMATFTTTATSAWRRRRARLELGDLVPSREAPVVGSL